MIGGFDDYVDFAARKHGPWVYLAYLILLFAGYGLFYWVRGIYRHGPKAFLRMRPRDLKDVQQLFYSYAEPARNGAYGIINTMVRGVSGHPNANVKAFIQLFQSRAPDMPCFENLRRVVNRSDFVSDEELLRRVCRFWNEYREKRCLVLDQIDVMLAAGIDIPGMPQFRHWLDADKKLLDELRRFAGHSNREMVRKCIDRLDPNVTDALSAYIPTTGFVLRAASTVTQPEKKPNAPQQNS